MDYVIMHSWNGGWSWSNFYNERKYLVEIPCSSTLNNGSAQSLVQSNNNTFTNEKSKQPTLENVIPNPASNFIFVKINSQMEEDIDVQIFDTAAYKSGTYADKIQHLSDDIKPVIIVMDYAFGEQAYETMDELLKPYKPNEETVKYLNITSVSIMGKAGILQGGKGDIMIPSAHIFEGTADNYPLENGLTLEAFEGHDLGVYDGAMVSVLGTSLQNKDLLRYFSKSTWGVVGLEMEGAHYQKAIQAASKIRKSISPNVTVNYAYYASDNPLETGSTLASGGLGTTGVKPTYLITEKILDQVFGEV